MFIQCGCAPLHLVLLNPFLSADGCVLLVERLLAAGAAVNQTVAGGGEWVCICMLHRALIYFVFCYI